MTGARWGAAGVLALSVLCGCGASMTTPDQVLQGRATLLSDARESALLAQSVAAGSTLGASTSSHAQVLSDDVRTQADNLSQGTPPLDQRDRVRRLLRDANMLGSLLDRLAQASDPAAAAALHDQLQTLTDDIAGA